ncbi:acyl-CoA thioesterase/bile acid-CoA:amino acid N-acyltransferase family protein [Bordetella bronchialis]|uniref:Acyl-CoA thioester hydrolase n=1 Tax=Bordetella bronchialis TaxID=463025 RepID=A0A193FY07_9BORD|nr:acyl-CoA thioesterase/bile acid-CoA:amino acid N-acyltransferase family protein [Bordetella bronchialis]ANN72066.1 acyl-CoA thioester hydrolase [Bordetella bronchialis]
MSSLPQEPGAARATLRVEPADAALDVARRIVLGGFPAGPVRVRAELRHPDGSIWQSQATYSAGPDGTIDLDRQAPDAGDWESADAMALVWAMKRTQAPTDPERTDETDTLAIAIDAESADGRASAHATLVQRYMVDGVTRQEVDEDGLVGTVFRPAGGGPRPVIMVLNGSGGGIPRQRAALYAAHGYTAFALGYFKAPGLPAHISRTPLEYFQRALHWTRARLDPARGFVAVTGQSRGGELTLLLASRFPELVNAAIAYVPSAVVHGTLRAGAPGEAPDSPTWTWQGAPLRNVWQDNPQADWAAFNQIRDDGQPVRQAPAFHTPLRDPASVAAARIAVEDIRGPVMLVSGTDDGFWPSTLFSEQIAATLSRHGHRWPVEHVCGQGAGHAIGLPNVPTTLIAKPHPVAGVVLTGGGTPEANARANRQSWDAVQRFLAAAVAAHGGAA